MERQEDKEIWIFLSHSNKDFAKVRLIRNYLEERSCRPLIFYLKCLSNDDEIDDLIKREIDCRKDEEEAERLFGISFRMNDALDTIGYPGGTLFVARCMANGYGTKKDLAGALNYYGDYIRTSGSNDNCR